MICIAFFPLRMRLTYSLFVGLFPAIRSHLSWSYFGQSSRKCCFVSLQWPHAGQLALSVLLILWRYAFKGIWLTRSWKGLLAPFLEMSGSLVSFRNLDDGRVGSMCLSCCVHDDFCHSLFHMSLSLSLGAALLRICFSLTAFGGLWGASSRLRLCPLLLTLLLHQLVHCLLY